MSGRLETGPVYVEGDWPGIFIRGDQALAYAMYLDCALPKMDAMSRVRFAALVRLLRKCDARAEVGAQRVERVYPAAESTIPPAGEGV